MQIFAVALLMAQAGTASGLDSVARLTDNVRMASFPQLKSADITFRELHSDSVYLEARFTMTSYFFSGKLRYMMFFNDEAVKRKVPPAALRAIVAHELSHIDYYQRQSRMGLASLTRLLLPDFNARFERTADLETIALGYGSGLEEYRNWLYRNIPPDRMPDKKRDYFSPREIEILMRLERGTPGFIRTIMTCVPRSEAEIDALGGSPHAPCPRQGKHIPAEFVTLRAG